MLCLIYFAFRWIEFKLHLGIENIPIGNLSKCSFSKSTSSRRPLRLIYYEADVLEEDALGRERFLKSGAGRRHLDKQLHHYFLKFPRR